MEEERGEEYLEVVIEGEEEPEGTHEVPGYEYGDAEDGEEPESYGEAFAGFQEGLEGHFTEIMKQSQKAPQDAYEHFQGFLLLALYLSC